MTTQTVQLQTFDYGASLTSATLRNVADDTLVATADSVNEVTADSGLYAAVFDETSVIAAGTYRLRAVVGGQPINRYVTLAGINNEVVQARTDKAVELDPAARVKLDASQPDYVPATASALATVYALLQLTDTDVASILTTVGAIETKIGTPATSLAAMIADVPTVSEFEARTIAAASYRQNITLRGSGMTEAKAFDLLLAASAGITSQPSGTTEKFKFLDGNDAFTTTFDASGNRTGVSLA